MKRSAFTMVELIFVIVIIGVLASIGIPKLSGVSDGAKKTAEIATISAVSTALESAHGEWSINENAFIWGNSRSSTELNSLGYPNDLNASGKVFGAILKGDSADFNKIGNTIVHADYNISIFTGPASNSSNGVKFSNSDIANKPDKNDFWIYIPYIKLPKTSCTHASGKIFYVGDFLLIDVQNTETADYTLTCN